MTTCAEDGGHRWMPLYRAGAASAAAAVILYLAGFVIVAVSDPAPESGGAATLAYVNAHRTGYIIRQVLWEAPALFIMVVVLALAVALRARSPSLAAVAGMIAVSSWAVSFAWPTTGDGSLAMVTLSDRYADAATPERASLVAGADMLELLNDMPVLGVLQTLGILLISLLMLQGTTTFGAGLAWLGVATGAIGIVAEALRPVLGWAYAVYGLLLFAWLAWVAVALWRLTRADALVARRAQGSG